MSKFHRQDSLQGVVSPPQGEILKQFPEAHYLSEALKTRKPKKKKKKKKAPKTSY